MTLEKAVVSEPIKWREELLMLSMGKQHYLFFLPTFLNGSGHWSLHDVERRDSCLFWVWLFQCNACQDAIKPYESEGLGFRCLLRIPA